MANPTLHRRLAAFFLAASLALSACAVLPRCEDAFWSPEIFTARLLVPLPLLLLLFFSPREEIAVSRAGLKTLSLWWPLLGLMLLLLLSSLAALRVDLALRESGNRLLPLLAFLAAFQLSQDAEIPRRLRQALLALGCLQGLIALLQLLCWNFAPGALNTLDPQGLLALLFQNSFHGRASGLLGNPDFLGANLLLALPLSFLDCKDGTPTWKLFRPALIAAGLAASQSRSAILIGLLSLLVLWRLRRSEAKAPRELSLLLASLLALGFGFFLLLFLEQQGGFALGNGSRVALTERIALWRVASQMILEKPWLGVGAGNFPLYFPFSEGRVFGALGLPFVLSSHAHNDFLQFGAEFGLPALLLLLAIHLPLYRALLRGMQEAAPGAKEEILGVVLAFGALELDALANFPFLIQANALAAAVLLGSGLRLALAFAPPHQGETLDRGAAWRWGTLLLGLYCLSAFDAARSLINSGIYWTAQGESQAGQWDAAFDSIEEGIQVDPHEIRFWKLEAEYYGAKGHPDAALASWEKVLSLDPWDPEALLARGNSLFALARYGESADGLKSACDNLPNDGELWRSLGNAQYMEGKYADAEASEREALAELGPDASLYENLAAAQGSQGEFSAALQSLDAAEPLNPKDPQFFLDRALTLSKMGKRNDAKRCLEDGLTLNPGNPALLGLRAKLP